MSDMLTRRGLTKLMLAAGAGLMLPSIVAADRGLAARLAAVPDRRRLIVDLHLRHEGSSGLVLVAGVIHLEGELASPLGDHPLVLRSALLAARNPMSRAAPSRREAPPIVLAPGQERFYARFSALWPRELSTGAEASLSARAVLDVEPASRPRSERAALLALARVRATTSVTLPA